MHTPDDTVVVEAIGLDVGSGRSFFHRSGMTPQPETIVAAFNLDNEVSVKELKEDD